MWFVTIALVVIVTPLLLGRWLARARVEQTNPIASRGPSLAAPIALQREAAIHNVLSRRSEGLIVHLN